MSKRIERVKNLTKQIREDNLRAVLKVEYKLNNWSRAKASQTEIGNFIPDGF